LENLSDDGDINRAWESRKENIKTSAKESLGLHELKHRKPWFEEECLGFLDQKMQSKMQWVHDLSQSSVDKLNTVKREASRHFRNKKKANLKAGIEELENNSKIKNIKDFYRGISDFKKGYQPKTNIVKDEKGDMVTDSHSILARWRNHFSQLLNIHGVNDIRQTELHPAEPLVPKLSAFELESAMEKLESNRSPGIDQIPIEFIKAGDRTIHSEIHKHIISIWNKEKLLEEWKESIIVPIYKKDEKQIVVVIGAYHFWQLCTKFYPTSCRLG